MAYYLLRPDIKNKLIYAFTSIVFLILVSFALLQLQYYSQLRENSYDQRIKDNAYYIGMDLIVRDFDVQKTRDALLDSKLNNIRSQRLTIYDDSNRIVVKYNKGVKIDSSVVNEYRNVKETFFSINDTQFIAFTLKEKDKKYLVVSSAYDNVGFQKYKALRKTTILLLVSSIIFLIIIGFWFSGIVLRPINSIIKSVADITGTNLHLRVPVKNKDDELGKLAATFNDMLDRVENSFLVEKSFVANASHEYRTPLTAMKGQIEVALMRERSIKEYIDILQSLDEDIDRLIGLQTALSELVKAQRSSNVYEYQNIPFLELISEARENLLQAHSDFQIILSIEDTPDNTDESVVRGDELLLISALKNLMDNACKYSTDKSCTVVVSFYNKRIYTRIIDRGTGIPEKDLPFIFNPFYRGENVRGKKGFGIGLSIVKRIIDIHSGHIVFHSQEGKGTTVSVDLPSIA